MLLLYLIQLHINAVHLCCEWGGDSGRSGVAGRDFDQEQEGEKHTSHLLDSCILFAVRVYPAFIENLISGQIIDCYCTVQQGESI